MFITSLITVDIAAVGTENTRTRTEVNLSEIENERDEASVVYYSDDAGDAAKFKASKFAMEHINNGRSVHTRTFSELEIPSLKRPYRSEFFDAAKSLFPLHHKTRTDGPDRREDWYTDLTGIYFLAIYRAHRHALREIQGQQRYEHAPKGIAIIYNRDEPSDSERWLIRYSPEHKLLQVNFKYVLPSDTCEAVVVAQPSHIYTYLVDKNGKTTSDTSAMAREASNVIEQHYDCYKAEYGFAIAHEAAHAVTAGAAAGLVDEVRADCLAIASLSLSGEKFFDIGSLYRVLFASSPGEFFVRNYFGDEPGGRSKRINALRLIIRDAFRVSNQDSKCSINSIRTMLRASIAEPSTRYSKVIPEYVPDDKQLELNLRKFQSTRDKLLSTGDHSLDSVQQARNVAVLLLKEVTNDASMQEFASGNDIMLLDILEAYGAIDIVYALSDNTQASDRLWSVDLARYRISSSFFLLSTALAYRDKDLANFLFDEAIEVVRHEFKGGICDRELTTYHAMLNFIAPIMGKTEIHNGFLESCVEELMKKDALDPYTQRAAQFTEGRNRLTSKDFLDVLFAGVFLTAEPGIEVSATHCVDNYLSSLVVLATYFSKLPMISEQQKRFLGTYTLGAIFTAAATCDERTREHYLANNLLVYGVGSICDNPELGFIRPGVCDFITGKRPD